MWFAAAQASGKPATSSAAEVKTEQPSKSTEPTPDVSASASAAVKQETAPAASEPVTSAAETASSVSKDESEDKAVAVEDSDSEKMNTDASEKNKTEEAKEEVSCLLPSHLYNMNEFVNL